MLTGERCIAAARDTVAFDNLTDRDEVLAYLPLAWVGDHYLNYAQGFVAGFCMACPESADDRRRGPARDRPDLPFRAAARVRGAADAGDDPHGGRERGEALAVPAFHGRREALGREDRQPASRSRCSRGCTMRSASLSIYGPLKNALGFSRIRVAYTAGEAIGADLFAFYRSLGLNLKQLYGQTEAFLYVTAQADGAVRSDTVGPPAPHVDLRIAADGEVQFKSPGMFVGYLQRARQDR